MNSHLEMMLDVYREIGQDAAAFSDADTAHLVIHQNEVVGAALVPGLEVEPEETADGVRVAARVREGVEIRNPVHMCFGVLPEEGLQRIDLDVDVEPRARVTLLAHCMFPNAVDVTHEMEARIRVAEGAGYRYFERHVHGPGGGVLVVPNARVRLEPDASFETEFELVKGRVGEIRVDYEAWCAERSSLRMVARVAGRGTDRIGLREIAHLAGAQAAGVLLSRIAVRDRSQAEVYNELTASAPYARGHVDCKEIVQDEGIARATPIVNVRHPLAHVTHEAAIGSVDSKQLETLMARGMGEEQAVDLIIDGLLSQRSKDEPL